MSDLPPPPEPPPPPPPPPRGWDSPPPGYTPYGQHLPVAHGSYAGFWIRFLAVIIDSIILGIPFWILGAITGAYDTTTTDAFGNQTETTSYQFGYGYTPGVPMWFNLLSTAVGVAYYGMLEGGPTGQTLGKRVVGIRVVDAATGQPGIGVGRAIGRYFARFLSALPLLLGYFWMLWDDKKQTWHDKLVSSVVTKG
jgi:uncharacterized RDD family membrane protein YckC